MKKIVAIIAVVCMIFSVCAFPAFAEDPATATVALVLNGDAPAKVGDEFVVDVVVKDLTSDTLNTSMIELKYDENVVAPADSKFARSVIQRSDLYNGNTGEGVYASTDSSFANGKFTYTLYINPDQDEFEGAENTGIPYTGDFTIISLKFKVVAEGKTTIEVVADPATKIIPVAALTRATLSYTNLDLTIGDAPTTKTITAIDEINAGEVEIGGVVVLPEKVTAKVGEEATVEVEVKWADADTATAGEKTVEGTVTAPEGYELAADVKAVAKYTVKAAPATEITEIKAPEAQTVTVGATVVLPETVAAKAGEADLTLAVTWADVDTATAGEKTVEGTVTVPEGYKLADGVSATVTVTVTVEDPAPTTKTITAIESVKVEVAVGEEVVLPATLKATAGEDEVEVTVAWADVDTTTAGVQTVEGTVTAPDGYELAEGVKAVAEITVVAPEEGDKELPYYVEATYTKNGYNGVTFQIAASKNDAYTGSIVVKNQLTIMVTFMNGKTPLAVRGQNVTTNGDITDLKATFVAEDIPEGTDSVVISVVQDLNLMDAISDTNIGTPVANGYTFMIEK